jgi:hypothetical protein
MSVDDRLREAFRETDRSWDGEVPEALAALTARQRRENVARLKGISAAAAAVIAAVVLVVTNPRDNDQVPAPEPTTPTPTSAAESAKALDGSWVSDVLTRADVRRAARLAGDASDAATMLDGLPAVPFRFTMTIDGDRNELTFHVRSGGQESLMDQENVELEGAKLLLTPQLADGATIHGWTLDGGTLRMTFVSTTEAAADGVPAEAWQRLLYDTAAFTRGG